MCDTWIALHDATKDQRVLVGKNSDRPVFDCQPLVLHPRQTWPARDKIQLAYIELPQVSETYATLGSHPYWCWGYEEGINQHGVVIGNEAIYTKPLRQSIAACGTSQTPELGILGMELVRLGLERCRTAAQAVELIGQLTERYGQFGSGVPGKTHADGSYDNSFLIADRNEAWVLEAAGRRWAARRFTGGHTSISNQITIRSVWHAGSGDLEENAVRQGWWPEELRGRCDFAWAYSDETRSRQVSHIRLMRSRQLLAGRAGEITAQWMQRIARDHYEDTFLGGPYFDAVDPDFQSICMHSSPAGFTWGNTATSCVAVLPRSSDEFPIFWWTPGPPCNGCYVPFFVHGQTVPEIVSRAGQAGDAVTPPPDAPEDEFQSDSYWWLFRQLLDNAKGGDARRVPSYFEHRNRVIREKFDTLEEQMAQELPAVLLEAGAVRRADSAAAAQILDQFSAHCVDRVVAALGELQSEFSRESTIPSISPV